MSNLLNYVENESKSEFYPTPERLVKKMIEGIKWDYIKTILEPSAGKGDILREIAKKENYNRRGFDVDCIEIDPNLRQILKYNFSEELREERGVYNRQYVTKYGDEEAPFFQNGIHIVHDDFLTYTPLKKYHLIIMNPPFSNGDKHLLKALDMQKNGGNIVCLLNAETIRNPYTAIRKELVKELKEYNAQIEFIENAFASAERKTGVEVALIKVSITTKQDESDIFKHFEKAKQEEEYQAKVTDLVLTDDIKAAVSLYEVEAKAGLELIRQYKAMIPYMARNFGEDSFDKSPILHLTDYYGDGKYDGISENRYLRLVRLKYWRALLTNPNFVGKLTRKLQDEWREEVSKLADYDFTEFNICTLSTEMNSQIKKGVEDEIIAMFDRLTEEHSWYPECSKNKHLYDGWKTNKAHKIDKKVIIPCYGIFDAWDGKPRTYKARTTLEDIERILNFLDGNMTENVDSWNTLDIYFKRGETKNVPMKYFSATFYKKGTVHLTFTCPELIERFNIYAAQHKAWLPPNYGKTKYKDMTAEEKAVIDSFQGEQAYNEVMTKANYYLAPVTNNQMLMLGASES